MTSFVSGAMSLGNLDVTHCVGSGWLEDRSRCVVFNSDEAFRTGPDVAVSMSSANMLVGIEFASRYRLLPRVVF